MHTSVVVPWSLDENGPFVFLSESAGPRGRRRAYAREVTTPLDQPTSLRSSPQWGLDTSITLKWFLEDDNDRAFSLAILRSFSDAYRPIVPSLWYRSEERRV